MTLYFAYGTNMDRAAMRLRCPGARAIGTGTLEGWRLLVAVDGYVSIVRRPGARVHGVLWRLTAHDLAALDAYEGVDAGLYRRRMLPVIVGVARRRAQVYISRSAAPGRPRPGHLSLVMSAAQSWHLPITYRDELRRFASSGWHGARTPQAGEVR
ncbi:MAG: gamma-glutamylcyclotransferase [Rhizobiales bacterium]|nr:gamma-glutamylcyclotransferase [Hyphomicrobiales bacterium]